MDFYSLLFVMEVYMEKMENVFHKDLESQCGYDPPGCCHCNMIKRDYLYHTSLLPYGEKIALLRKMKMIKNNE